jgi:gliding motility-associated-like protein
VVESALAKISMDDVTIVELSDHNSITVNTLNLGIGDYEFALDHITGIYQDEPYFDHLSAGMHTLYVKDKKGCGIAQLDIFIMGFPKFFTPNDDGFHDTWNIEGLSNEYTRNSRVYIFDRYGKLLIQLDPKGANWNGTFNGEKLRPSDYWFVAELFKVDGTIITYRGHFSLVR